MSETKESPEERREKRGSEQERDVLAWVLVCVGVCVCVCVCGCVLYRGCMCTIFTTLLGPADGCAHVDVCTLRTCVRVYVGGMKRRQLHVPCDGEDTGE
jgi:hypothetical protein